MQAIVYKNLLHKEFPYAIYRQFSDKMGRWRLSTSFPKQSSYLPPLMFDVSRSASVLKNARIPERVFSAIFLSWCTAWVTNRRSQERSLRCPLCRNDWTESSLEHFSCCNFQLGLGSHFLNLPRKGGLRHFFALPLNRLWQLATALFIYMCSKGRLTNFVTITFKGTLLSYIGTFCYLL